MSQRPPRPIILTIACIIMFLQCAGLILAVSVLIFMGPAGLNEIAAAVFGDTSVPIAIRRPIIIGIWIAVAITIGLVAVALWAGKPAARHWFVGLIVAMYVADGIRTGNYLGMLVVMIVPALIGGTWYGTRKSKAFFEGAG